ncbi:hypothetical protein BJX70DRAFT_30757 [Aspergillus crustosus]
MLGYPANSIPGRLPNDLREPQPMSWNELLLERDGADSGASVTIYRSTMNDSPCSVMKPGTRQLFVQTPPSVSTGKNFGEERDKYLLSESELKKELLVIVRRGRIANTTELDPPINPQCDIRVWAKGMSWPELKERCSCGADDGSPELAIEVDTYTDVNEYVVHPLVYMFGA